MRRRSVVKLGSLATRASVEETDGVLVDAVGADGTRWWIPAAAVWSDSACGAAPQRPRAVGLATADSPSRAAIAGLSDRLGWEAGQQRRRGAALPELPTSVRREAEVDLPADTEVLDGRLDHDVPTVVIARENVVRWGAGENWAVAAERAMYGATAPCGTQDAGSELSWLDDVLGCSGLGIATVDLGTERLRLAGIYRCSTQVFR